MDEQKEKLATFDKAVLDRKATWWQMDLPSGEVIFGDVKAEMLGFPASKFSKFQDFTSLVHEDDYEGSMQAMREHLEGKIDRYETIYRIKNSRGEYIKFFDCGKIIERNGENIKVMGFVLKLDDGKNEERQKNAFRRLVVDGEPSLVDIIKDMQETV